MEIIHEPLRYAHDEGYTDVCYSEDGESFVTCGADGDIRIWSVNEGEDPHHTCIGEWAVCVRQKGDKLFVSTGANEIQILSYPDGERNGILSRGTDPFNQIGLCKNKNIVALASEGMEVSIMDLDTCAVLKTFTDLNGPCLSVALCPNATKVAASCGDGKLKIWELETELLLKELSCFPKVNSFSNSKILCRIDFHPSNGIHMAYPEKNNVKLLNTCDWSEELLSCEKVSADFSVLQFSNCGKYLAAASIEGDFVIWDLLQKEVLKISKHESAKAICALMWNPKGNGEIVYTDEEGQLGVMSNCLRHQQTSKNKEILDKTEFIDNEVICDDQFDNYNDDDDDENVISIEKIRKECIGTPESELRERASSRTSSPVPRLPAVPLQSSFMPASTPQHLDPRFFCWNDVGIIKSYGNNADDEMASKSIEVEFHDTTFHNSMMLPNYQEYTMGSISRGALVVANSSQIMVIPLSASNREWSLKVEEHEEIILVATSENLICFATSNYVIRMCSLFGTQRGVISVPGPLVSMSAFKNILLVAYHAGGVRERDQCINLKLFKLKGTTVESHDLGSALGPETTLFWLGFSDVGTPGMMDSSGVLSLFPPKCNTWIPFCDTKKHQKSPIDGFFVTAVYESYQAVGGIKCKGAMYPAFIPRPTVCELPLEPLFSEISSEKTMLEMNLFTWSNLQVMDTNRKYKETALKTFALACKNDLDQRAFEFIEIINDPQILNLALKYASKLNKKRLAEKLIEFASKLREDDAEIDDQSSLHLGITGTPVAAPENQTVIKPSGKFSISKLTPKSRKTEEMSQHTREKVNQNENNESNVNTQETLFTESFTESPVNSSSFKSNPFLKKREIVETNPLSLTDKFAGVHCELKQNCETGEKRKQPDANSEGQVEKQRKLSRFMFSKR